jgi:hypothetical protein
MIDILSVYVTWTWQTAAAAARYRQDSRHSAETLCIIAAQIHYLDRFQL